jgi:hypothetical protein
VISLGRQASALGNPEIDARFAGPKLFAFTILLGRLWRFYYYAYSFSSPFPKLTFTWVVSNR